MASQPGPMGQPEPPRPNGTISEEEHTMKSVVFDPAGERLAVHDEPRKAAPGELLLEVAFCGICGSDLHAAEPDYRDGTIMGHEFSGIIAGIGEGVEGWTIGDRVCVNPNGAWCGTCESCVAGEVNMCPNIRPIGLSRHGGLAAKTSVPAHIVHKLPDSVSLEAGAWVEPLAVALRTVHRSGAGVGDRAAVFGAGPIGLLVTMLLRAAGLVEVTVIETSPERRAKAMEIGATHTVDPLAVDCVQYFSDTAAAPRFAFECTGVAEVTETAVRILRPHGRLTVTGFARRPPTYRAQDLLFKEIEIRGSYIYVEEFAQAIDLLGRGTIDISPLISGVVDLDESEAAFAAMRSNPSAVKYLIRPTT
jgi:threonine dehydrogenase-like Zn-dependent dehydrogenase